MTRLIGLCSFSFKSNRYGPNHTGNFLVRSQLKLERHKEKTQRTTIKRLALPAGNFLFSYIIFCIIFLLDAEFMNAIFAEGELVHGFRYIVCIHAEPTDLEFEEWTQPLETLSICSDGVTIDFTKPTAGRVWIGQNPTDTYQVMHFYLC